MFELQRIQRFPATRRARRNLTICIAAALAAACGSSSSVSDPNANGDGEVSAAADVSGAAEFGAARANVTASAAEATASSVAAVYQESQCAENQTADFRPFSEQLTEIREWRQVTGVVEDSQRDEIVDNTTVRSIQLESIELRSGQSSVTEVWRTAEWEAALTGAVNADDAEVYIGLSGDPIRMRVPDVEFPVLTLVVGADEWALAGKCAAELTDAVRSGVGSDAAWWREALTLDPAAIPDHVEQLATAHDAPDVQTRLMPQYLPGLAEQVDLDPATLVERSVRVRLNIGDAETSEGICVGTAEYVGECFELSAFEPDGANLIADMLVLASPTDDIVLYRVRTDPTIPYEPLRQIDAADFPPDDEPGERDPDIEVQLGRLTNEAG